jgi:two-component system, sensor histidine kinase and response regulator
MGFIMEKKDTILVVDDTQTNIDILIELLDDYDIIVATDGQSAIEILNDDKDIDLILLDIMMPYMDGFEVCEILKNNDETKDIPIIFLTAKTDVESIQKGFEIGGVDYITKPFRPIELLARIKTHLKIVKHEKKAIEHNKYIALAELIHNIAHQWRQPLSVISTSSSGMHMQKELGILKDEDILKFCDGITHNAEYLSSTIENFKTFIENSNEIMVFDIKEVLNSNYTLFFGDIFDNKIIVDINIEDDIKISGCKNNFIQLLLSIITNSKDVLYESEVEHKIILINIKNINNTAVINIKDSGLGIPKDILSRVFEPYFTTKHKSQGKGLGLYMVRNIVKESFTGTLDVVNEEFNHNDKIYKGASFEIKIPTT